MKLQNCSSIDKMNISESLRLDSNILSENKYSSKKAVWTCDKHGDYIQSINSHYLGRTGCKKCLKLKRSAGKTLRYNDELMDQLNIEESLKLNENILDCMVTDREDAVWICKEHGNFIQKIQYRLYGYVGCKVCDKINKYGYRVTYITDTSIKDRIDYEQCKIDGIDPFSIIKSSNKYIPLVCKHGHKWSVQARSAIHTNAECPICLRRKEDRKDSLGILRPDLIPFYSKNNEYSAYEIGVNSLDEVEWICKNGHKFRSCVHTQNYITYPADNVRCPYCSGMKRLTGINDFATFNKDIMDEWYWEENDKIGLDPNKLPIFGTQKAFFKCRNNPEHIWSTTLTSRSTGSGCPKCFKSRNTSSQEVAISMVLNKIGLHTLSREKIDGFEFDVRCDNPKLLIEYHGMAWHDIEASDRDIHKAEVAKRLGYDFIIIREFRDLEYIYDDLILKRDDNGINTIYFNIGKNYEKLHKLLELIVNITCKVYNINSEVDIDYASVIKDSRKYIGLRS